MEWDDRLSTANRIRKNAGQTYSFWVYENETLLVRRVIQEGISEEVRRQMFTLREFVFRDLGGDGW